IGIIWAASAAGRIPFWAARPGGVKTLRILFIDSPFMYLVNWIGVFGSPNKGIFVYAPILLLTLVVFPQVLRTHRRIAIFSLLLVGSIAAQLALLRAPADEVWGARYMHSTIAPLLVVLGAAYPFFQWRRGIAIPGLAGIGAMAAFLGAFFYYGQVHFATMKAGQNTLEWLAGDSVWNPVEFNARLFQTWLRGNAAPAPWTPKHVWMYEPPPESPPVKTIDLREFSEPQAMLVKLWDVPKVGRDLRLFLFYLLAFPAGVALAARAAVITVKVR